MMKIYYSLLFSLVCAFTMKGQQISDALRYSTEDHLGTARYTALSGSMGALGGDLSAMEANPAGGAVFSNSYATFSAGHRNNGNSTTYFGNDENSTSNRFNLNQAGGVFVFHNDNESSKFRKLSIGINYNLQNNFNNEVFLAGRGNTSITEYFMAQAQGIPLELLDLQRGETISSLYRYLGETEGTRVQNAFLGYQGYLFDPVDPDNPDNTSYLSNVAGDKFDQKYLYLTGGTNARFTINIAAQVSDILYLGANINTYGFDFRQTDAFTESNNHSASIVNRIGFENRLTTYGSGISAQFGAIARVSDNIRLGLSLDTPTWYQVSEETSQYLETRRIEDGANKTTVVNPNVINVYEDYTLRTPGKATLSAAYIFGQSALINIDYTYKGYSGIRFQPSSDNYFKDLNSAISNELKGASIIRAGGEYRLNNLSFRGGFHYEENPYNKDDIAGDLIGFSLGAGINLGYFNIDLAFRHSERKGEIQMYPVGFTNRADSKSTYNNVILSLAYSL